MKESKALRTFPSVPAVFDTLQVNAIPCSANYQTTYYKLLPVWSSIFNSHYNTVSLSTPPERQGMPQHSAPCHVLTTYPQHLYQKRNSVNP